MHYYQFNIKSFHAATAHLSNEEDLAYRRLLDMYYDTEQPIPTAIPPLTRRLRVGLQELETVLNEFFELTERGWVHHHCESVIAEFNAFIERQRRNGKLGGKPRKTQALPTANPPLTQCKPSAKPPITHNPQPITNNQEKPKKHTAEYSAEFLEAWGIYPSRPGANKKEAFKAWSARLKAGVSASLILDGVRRYAAYCKAQQTDPQFIKQPATFFGPGDHYLSDWTVQSSNSSSRTPRLDNFDEKDYGKGVTLL